MDKKKLQKTAAFLEIKGRSKLTKEELEKTEKGKGWKQGFLSEY